MNKERVTVSFESNMNGMNKFKPFVISKSQNSHCFRNSRRPSCVYESKSKALKTSDLFVKWIRKFYERMKKETVKVLCLTEKYPAHPKDIPDLEIIELVFLPFNATIVIQSMDQGIFHVLKAKRKKCVVLRHQHQMDYN